MTRAARDTLPVALPRLMPAPVAAAYLGISTSKLATLPIPRKVHGGNRAYDRYDLDAYASDLPYEGDIEAKGEESCDTLFGVKE